VAALLRLAGGVRQGLRSGAPALLVAAAMTAYVLAAPYALPWYDAVAWAALGYTVIAAVVDRVLVVHTAVLTLAYLPGRAAVALPGGLAGVMAAIRAVAAPVTITTALVVIFVLAASYHRRSSAAPAGSPGARRILPAPAAQTRSPRQERGTHLRP
jgi:uncharacterized membrane protein